MRHVKIVATIGPASSSSGMLEQLFDAGMNVARVNFYHGTPDHHRDVIRRIKKVRRELNKAVAILQDLQGPKIRVQEVQPDTVIVAGQDLVITTRQLLGNKDVVSTSYISLPKDVKYGDMILIDDGKIELKVKEVREAEVLTEVVYGGPLKSRKGINLPFTKVTAPSLTEKDLHDLDWTERRWNGMQAYCDSKLHVTTLALALARRWPDRYVNVVDPGWVPTRMGGPGAPDDLELGHRTQAWLAVSDEPEAATSGGYWHHQQRRAPAAIALDGAYQDALLRELARLTDVSLA